MSVITMEQASRRASFNRLTNIKPQQFEAIVAATKLGDQEAGDKLCASLSWAAFACPNDMERVYDEVSAAWLDQTNLPITDQKNKNMQPLPIPTALSDAFWLAIDDADKGYDAISITVTAAALAGHLDAEFLQVAETAAIDHPCCDNAADNETPTLYTIASLADLVAGFDKDTREQSLANTLHRTWIDNNFDPEVLDRETAGLGHLPPNLCYLNTRILQMHDVWHLVAGYETTALHEIAISGFQLAQFGHNYSANFLALITMMTHWRSPKGLPLLMQTICEAWVHGRKTPSMMAVEWQAVWHKSIAELRETYSIEPYNSAIPANIIETLREAEIQTTAAQ